jgi:putative DNA methylase
MTDTNTTLCTWQVDPPRLRATFGRQALPMTWDFAEANIFGDAAGDYQRCIGSLCEVLDRLVPARCGQVEERDARQRSDLVGRRLVSTDPPYYDNVPYADLSDFFYVWLRRSLAPIFPDLFGTLLVPKAQELVAEAARHGSREGARQFFEEGLNLAFRSVSLIQHPDYPLTVYYAFKQAEAEEQGGPAGAESTVASTGWETMLEGLIASGFSVTGTWPSRSEWATRIRGQSSNALASSIVLVCRPRPVDALSATRREFISALKRELPDALHKLQHGNIAPVDLAQAAIGPGMAVFSRYSKVLEANGSPMPVRTALALINQMLDEVLAEQEGEFDGDTRWALAWFEQYAMDEGPFGVAETLSTAKNTAVSGLAEAGILRARAGKVRLLKRDELPVDWDPGTDRRTTIWEVTQHLIRALEREGEGGAAALLRKMGAAGEAARDLAYRLYSICERKKWAQEALAYNSLVIAWPEIARLAAQDGTVSQEALF